MSAPRILLSGIDTLHLFTRAPLRDAEVAAVEAAKERAVEAPRRPEAAAVEYAGHALTVRPHGARTAPLLMDSEHMAVRLNPAPATNLPTAAVELRALYLWQRGAAEAAAEAQRVANALTAGGLPGAAPEPLRVSRLDLTVDFQGWSPRPEDNERFITRAAHRTMHQERGTFTGFMFGRGIVAARLYDKTVEIRASGKRWFRRLWAKAPHYDPGAPVWRLEFQLRREALRSMRAAGDRRVDTWLDVFDLAPTMWRHLATRWLALREPRTRNTRQLPTPEWAALADGGFSDGTWPGSDENLYRVAREDKAANTTAQLAGYIAAGLAEVLYLQDPDASLDEAIPQLVRRARKYASARGRPVEARARQRVREWTSAENSMRARRRAASVPSARTDTSADVLRGRPDASKDVSAGGDS
jgi:hypothetical protein